MYTEDELHHIGEKIQFRPLQGGNGCYGYLVNKETRVKIGMIIPCLSIGRRCGTALLRNNITGELTIVTVMIEQSLRDVDNNTDVVKILLNHALTTHECLCGGLGGGRISYDDRGYYTFGLGNYPIGRIWVNMAQADHSKMVFGGTTYHIQPITMAKWIARENDYEPSFVETDSYYNLLVGVIPEIHARREGRKRMAENGIVFDIKQAS